MKFPEVIIFEDLGPCFYTLVSKEKMAPNKGEYFLSGSVVTAYRAYHDMTTKYYIAIPTFKAFQKTMYVYGDIISR